MRAAFGVRPTVAVTLIGRFTTHDGRIAAPTTCAALTGVAFVVIALLIAPARVRLGVA